jgi:hypothetical protein
VMTSPMNERHAKVWVVPEQDKTAVRNRAGTSKRLRQALGPGGGPGILQLVNHSCCPQHRNAEFQLTRVLDGDPRITDSDEDGEIVLVIQAPRRISSQEQILVHYNPGAGIGTWAEVFQCRCCQCRGACVPAENCTSREKDSFKQQIQQVHHAGQEFDDDIRVEDFVQTRNSIFAGCDVTAKRTSRGREGVSSHRQCH